MRSDWLIVGHLIFSPYAHRRITSLGLAKTKQKVIEKTFLKIAATGNDD